MNGGPAYLVATAGCLLGVVGVVIAVVALRRSKQRDTGSRPAPADPFRHVDDDADALRGDPRRLRVGDIVEIRGVSYGVRGSLRFAEGDWTWQEHLLDDTGETKRWLSVEEDPDVELVLWTTVPDAEVTPGAATVSFDGRRFVSDERGAARFTSTGTTGLNPSGSMRYHDYESSDGALLSFESYGDSGEWEVSRGERLHRPEVMIYPQSAPETGH